MNKLIVAVAGSGKTQKIIESALDYAAKGKRVAITTFTENCEVEIRKRMVAIQGHIPSAVTIQTWFSFLIEHGARPYLGKILEKDIAGLLLVSGKSGLRFTSKGGPVYWGEKNPSHFYTNSDGDVYSDKLSKLVISCNQASRGAVIRRLESCFDCILIDEIQDLAGADLNILELLFRSQLDVLLVGDPRQGTYSTHSSQKNKKYAKSGIIDFFLDTKEVLNIDDKTLNISHRCNQAICAVANMLFPMMEGAIGGNKEVTGHDGVFLVPEERIEEYFERFSPTQLRDSVKTATSSDYPAFNFGKSKGLTFQRTLIYPSKPILNWLADRDFGLTAAARSKLYVALTRARFSVGIVIRKKDMRPASIIEYDFK
jgi:DNA helicase-2/ATP-dependent DNA helicase PcrA